MKNYCWLIMAALTMVWTVSGLRAQTMPTPEETPSLPKPAFLDTKDLVSDSTRFYLPPPPRKDPNGSALELDIDKDNIPVDFAKLGLADPDNLAKIQAALKADDKSGRYYWHDLPNLAYCHCQNGGRDWLGWTTGSNFHWVLFRGGRFWWRDDYADRWIHWDQGYWWWQGELKNKPRFQMILGDGFYHACDGNGLMGDNLMRTGKEEVVTEPVEKSDLDSESKKHRAGEDHEIGE